jgi:predicted DNA-binding protein (MmcQ/YjbR family)
MDIELLREYCLQKPDTTEDLPFGPDVVVFKVKGKAFLLLSLDTEDLQFNVKCDPDRAVELREEYSCVQPGYHMNKKHWNTIIVDGTLNTKQLKQMVDHSYELVAEKANSKKRVKS